MKARTCSGDGTRRSLVPTKSRGGYAQCTRGYLINGNHLLSNPAGRQRTKPAIAESASKRIANLRCEEISTVLEEEALGSLSDLYYSNAMWQVKEGDLGEALLWFSESAELNRNRREQEKHLARCQTWIEQHPTPVGALHLDAAYKKVERGTHDEISFLPKCRSCSY